MEFYHEQYNVELCDKFETVLGVLCLNYGYLFLGQEDLYMDSQHSTQIHIYSLGVHDHTEDMCKLYLVPCQMICHKYDVHVASLYFYMFHFCDVMFHQISYSEHFGFYIFSFFKYLSLQDIND